MEKKLLNVFSCLSSKHKQIKRNRSKNRHAPETHKSLIETLENRELLASCELTAILSGDPISNPVNKRLLDSAVYARRLLSSSESYHPIELTTLEAARLSGQPRRIATNSAGEVSVAPKETCVSETDDYAIVTFSQNGDNNAETFVFFDVYGSADLSVTGNDGDYLLYQNANGNYKPLNPEYTWYDGTIYKIRFELLFSDGVDSVDVKLCPRDDSQHEGPETVAFSVVSGNNYSADSYETATVTILDDDPVWKVTIVAIDPEASEAPSDKSDVGVLRITRAGRTDFSSPLQTRFTLTGSALYPYAEDYALTGPSASYLVLEASDGSESGEACYIGTVTIPAGYDHVDLVVRPRNDQKREKTEKATATLQVSLTLDPETGNQSYELGEKEEREASVTIKDNDQWSVGIEATLSTAAEEDADGVHYGRYTITRSGEEDVSFPLKVYLEASGTATTQDYRLYRVVGDAEEAISVSPKIDAESGKRYYSWSVVIPANSFSVVVELRPVDDHYAENNETATMEILTNELYDVVQGVAKITIEEETEIKLSVVDSEALEPCEWLTVEERRAQYRLTVITTETDWSNITVQLNCSGTATAGNKIGRGDYYLTTDSLGNNSSALVAVKNNIATLMIPAGENQYDFYLMAKGDDELEIDNSFNLFIDEIAVLKFDNVYSGSTSNRISRCRSFMTEVKILQAPEFVSDVDSSPTIPSATNADYYNLYVNVASEKHDIVDGGKKINAIIPHTRYLRYELIDQDESAPLLNLKDDEITLCRLLTNDEILDPPSFTIKVYDRDYEQLFDVATINVVPLVFDLNIDSDNSNGLSIPDGSKNEDSLEDHEYGLGKVIQPNTGDADNDGIIDCWEGYVVNDYEPLPFSNSGNAFVPITVTIPDIIDVEDLQLTFEYLSVAPYLPDAFTENPLGAYGSLRIWKKDGIHMRTEADYIRSSRYYRVTELGFTATSRSVTFYVEGMIENQNINHYEEIRDNEKQDTKINTKLRLLNQQGKWITVASDVVRYVVANPNSFYYAMAHDQSIRCAVASAGVYSDADLPKFGLKWAGGDPKLNSYIRSKVYCANAQNTNNGNPNAVHNSFNAGLYFDYSSQKNIVTFQGTQEPSDWLDNFNQRVKWESSQYVKAMDIGSWIYEQSVKHDVDINDIIFTGHSLGGGLTSACTFTAVSTSLNEKKAYTFNAAGLLPETYAVNKSKLEERTKKTDFSINYNRSAELINAYVVKGEILNEQDPRKANGEIIVINYPSESRPSESTSSLELHRMASVFAALENNWKETHNNE